MPHIYALPIQTVILIVFFSMCCWTALFRIVNKRIIRCCAFLLLLFALYGMLRYSVLRRAPSDAHVFTFSMSPDHNEFLREMIMYALLYLSLGLSLTVLIGPWLILASFVLSLGIETWQYFAGAGLSQGTDVLCNTLGCAVGSIPWFVSRWIDGIMQRRSR